MIEAVIEWYPYRGSYCWKSNGTNGVVIRSSIGKITLNNTAAFFWKECNGDKPLSEIISAVCARYTGVSIDKIKRDILDLSTFFLEKGLLYDVNNLFRRGAQI